MTRTMRPARRGSFEPRTLALLLLAFAATACLRQETDAGIILRSPSPSTTAAPIAPGAYTVGQTVVTPTGNRVAIYTFEAPPSGGSGLLIGAADAEACIAQTATMRFALDPSRFALELSDRTRRPSVGQGPKAPLLEPQTLEPGRCARGWIHFEYRADETPAAVVLQQTPPLRWTIS